MTINDPAVIAELKAQHETYERALIGNDVAVLDSMFWDSPHALRYGVTENLYGAEEIRAFRQNRPAINLERDVRRVEILTFGDSAGVINLEYVRKADAGKTGRQSQVWMRFPEGWKIVSAHVSVMAGPPSYMDAAAARIGLPIAPEMRSGVQADLDRIAGIAAYLMEFPLEQATDAGPVFHPGE
jgi:hypothetical protein